MTKEQFQHEKLYQATMVIARALHKQGLITEKEMRLIDTKMLEKYKPILGGLRTYNP